MVKTKSKGADTKTEKSAPPASPEKAAKKPSSSSSSPIVTLGFVAAVLSYWLANGNPTQQVGKLLKMCREGMAGGEGVDKFDAVGCTPARSFARWESSCCAPLLPLSYHHHPRMIIEKNCMMATL